MQAQAGANDQAQPALRAAEELSEVVAGDVLDDLPAGARDRAVREHDRHPQDDVPRRAVAVATRPGQPLREAGADGRVAGRIERQHLATLGEHRAEGREAKAGLDGRGQVARLVLEDAIEACGGQDDVGGLRTVGAGRGARSKRVAEASRRYRIGEVFSGHGPEPLSRGFTVERLKERLARRSAKLKTLLLDQSFIAGVGNIYADEALWRARLHPLRAADTLDDAEVRRLHRSIRKVLRQGIANRGSSFSDYVSADGRARRERGAADGLPAHRPAMLPMRAADPAHRRRPAQHPLLSTLPAGAGRIGRAMKVIGLTGNIGCGKSTVAGMLRDLGAATVDADAVAREIRHNDAEARAEIQRRFGTYEAAELADVVFTDPDALRDLERILHPRVRGAIRARLAELAQGGVEVAAVEVIKLLESPLADGCDEIWVVRCDEADAISRLAASRGMDEATARARLDSQSSQEEKLAAADVVIDGSAPMEETRRQVERALATLTSG